MSYEGYNGTTGGFQTRTDDMRDAGSNFNKIASDYEGKIGELSNKVYALGSIWNDESYNRFKARFEEFLREYHDLKDKIEDFGNASLRSADIADDYENAIAQSADNIGE